MIQIDQSCCDRCGACISVCRGCALLLTDELHFDAACCSGCGICVRVCPFGALRVAEHEEQRHDIAPQC